jgi:hypothetical protein
MSGVPTVSRAGHCQQAERSIVSKPGSESKQNVISEPTSDPGKPNSLPDEHQQRAEWSIISRVASQAAHRQWSGEPSRASSWNGEPSRMLSVEQRSIVS